MIELDLREDPVREEAPAPREWMRGSRWVASVITLCLLLGLAGSVPLLRRVSRTAVLPVPAGTSYTLTDRRLYTLHGGATPVVSAYTLTGQRLWQVESRFADNVWFQEAGDLLLVRGVNRSGQAETLGVDALTGTQRWSLPQEVQVLADERTGLVTSAEFAGVAPDGAPVIVGEDGVPFYPAPNSTTLGAVDLATGRTLWSRPFAGSARREQLPGTAELVVAEPSGVTVLDPRTGGVLRSAPLTGGFAIEGLSVSEGLIIAQQAGRGGGRTYGYRPDTLEEIWRVRLPGNAVVVGCSGVPCAMRMSDVHLIDPATGAMTDEAVSADVLRQGGRTLLAPRGHATDLRVSPASGGAPTALPGWSLMPVSPAVRDWATAPVLLTRAADGRVWLAALSRSAAAPRELGSLAPAVLDCQSTRTMVACRTGLGEIRVWQLEEVQP